LPFVVASDGFFPFADNMDVLEGLPVLAVIQPGGSVRDPEVLARASQMGIPMVLTGERHFKH
jgi:phosphoribosylaminoimidazolecarboxamide formyltransferase/IMP cyclohydrolase